MRKYKVEILRISSFLMVFFYRRFLPLDVFIYAFGAENDASSSNLPIPFTEFKRLPQILHLRQPLFIFRFSYQLPTGVQPLGSMFSLFPSLSGFRSGMFLVS